MPSVLTQPGFFRSTKKYCSRDQCEDSSGKATQSPNPKPHILKRFKSNMHTFPKETCTGGTVPDGRPVQSKHAPSSIEICGLRFHLAGLCERNVGVSNSAPRLREKNLKHAAHVNACSGSHVASNPLQLDSCTKLQPRPRPI